MDYGVFADHNRHTCIRVHVGHKWTQYIPFDLTELRVHRILNQEFDRKYAYLPTYPVQKAVAIYTKTDDGVKIATISPEAQSHFARIRKASPDALRTLTPATVHQEFQPMATRKKAADKAADKTPKIAAKGGPKTKKAAPAAAPEPTNGKRGRKPTYAPDTVFTVANGEAVKRGAFRQIVDAAEKLGQFTAAQLEKACAKIDLRENQLSNTLAFGLRKGVFAPAS